MVFKDEQLVEEYNSESTKNTLSTQISNDGGYFLSQSYSIDKENSIVIDKDLSECCSSSGFEEPIRTKTKVRYRLDNNGSLKATEVLKMELTSNLFDEEFLANYKGEYPTMENPYRFIIDDNTQYFTSDNDSTDIQFYIRYFDEQLYPEIFLYRYYSQDKLMTLPIIITIPKKGSQTLYEEIQQQRRRRDERTKIYWEKEEKAEKARYEALPFITSKEIAAIRPVVAKWLDFYKIDLSQFKFVSQNPCDLSELPDTASIYYREYTDEYNSPNQINVDYSPDKRFYIDLGIWLQQDDDGKYYADWDDCQEIYFTDRKLKYNNLLLWFGASAFAEAVFWRNNNTFIVVGNSHTILKTLFIYVYNMKEDTLTEYNLPTEEGVNYHSDGNLGYMNAVNIKERGIITEKH